MIILKIFFIASALCSLHSLTHRGLCGEIHKTLHSFMTDKMLIYITAAIFCVYEMLIVRRRLSRLNDVWYSGGGEGGMN